MEEEKPKRDKNEEVQEAQDLFYPRLGGWDHEAGKYSLQELGAAQR